jgi:hypothetical protein
MRLPLRAGRGTTVMMVSKNVVWGLVAVAAGAGLAAVLWPSARSRGGTHGAADRYDPVDEASDESFPASDPPSHSAPAAATPGPVS